MFPYSLTLFLYLPVNAQFLITIICAVTVFGIIYATDKMSDIYIYVKTNSCLLKKLNNCFWILCMRFVLNREVYFTESCCLENHEAL